MPDAHDLLRTDGLVLIHQGIHPRSPELKAQHNQAVVDAYVRWAQTEDGQVILDDMVHSTLWKPCATREDEGERRFVLKILSLLANAQERRNG